MDYLQSRWYTDLPSSLPSQKKYELTSTLTGSSNGHGGLCNNDVAPIQPTPLRAQGVGADGVTFNDYLFTLIDNNGTADTGNVEAPVVVQTKYGYVLFFSSGCFDSSTYTVSYATASSLWGPWLRRGTIFKETDGGLVSPGGASVANDTKHMVFHAYQGSTRELYTALIDVATDLTVTVG